MRARPAELTWDAFQEFCLAPGTPKAITLPGRTPATFFVAERGRCMGLRVPAGKAPRNIASPLRQIEIDVRTGPPPVLELSTSARPLFKEFFLFAVDVAHAVQRDDVDVYAAVEQALQSWKNLLQKAARLSREAEVGAIGELLCLQRLQSSLGDRAVKAWTGPMKDRHDFRLDGVEIEVKTTASSARSRFINGWDQLQPSEGLKLFLLSVHLEPAGASDGFTLPELVKAVRARFGAAARPGIDERLETIGYFGADAQLYTDRFRRRSENRLIPVDGECPRLTRDLIKLPATLGARLEEIHYRIDVEGLGMQEDSAGYLKVLPRGRR